MTEHEVNAASIERYGHVVIAIDPITALHFAEYLATARNMHGYHAWKAVDRVRSRYGHVTVYPPYGHACFPNEY